MMKFIRRNVTKTHTSNTNTFQSPNHGPLGVLTKDRVQFHHMPYRQQALENVNDKLNVPLVKAYMGMPGDIFSFIVVKVSMVWLLKR